MANELPYFRFTVQAWQNGKISLEDYELKGLFIDVCGYYWVQDCSITIAMLEKRFKNARELIKQLIELEILKENNEGQITIDFLNEQFDLLSEKRKKRQLAGKKGGLSKSSNAKAMLKQSSSYKDKDNNKDNNKDKDKIEWKYKTDKSVIETLYKKIYKLFPDNLKPKEKRNDIWCDSLDKLIRIDNKTPDEIYKILEWAFKNEFWSKTIQSVSYLRKPTKHDHNIKYYEVLLNQMKNDKSNTTNSRNFSKITDDAW